MHPLATDVAMMLLYGAHVTKMLGCKSWKCLGPDHQANMAKQYCVMKEVSIQLVELMDLHITVIFIGKPLYLK